MTARYTPMPFTLAASAARTAAFNTDDQENNEAIGVQIYINCSAITATPGVTVTLQGKDPVSGNYFTILASAAIVGTGLTVLTVYPGITASGNVAVSAPLPRTWRLAITVADTDSATYSIAAQYLYG